MIVTAFLSAICARMSTSRRSAASGTVISSLLY
jgi:hypothetical protein